MTRIRAAALAGVCALATVVVADAAASAAPKVAGQDCVRQVGQGEVVVPVDFAGTTYDVPAYVPAGAEPDVPLPLVLNLHGSTGTGAGQLFYSDIEPTADEHQFLVAAPDGAIPAEEGFVWNVPGVGSPPPDARDDVGFLVAVIDRMVADLCADPARSYSTGFSGGGRMTSALACARPDRVAAVAPVAGLRAGRPDPQDATRPDPESCQPERAVPVLSFHGQEDTVNPYQGGGTEYWRYSVPAALQRWVEIESCQGEPVTEQVSEHVSRVAYLSCMDGSEVVLYVVSDGGHTWPGSPHPGGGNTTQEISANELMWEFFERFQSPPVKAFPPSTKEAVLAYLESITGSGIVSGQHNKEPADRPSQYTAQVNDVTGMYPGMWGGELMFNAADVANRQLVFDQAKTEWNNGALITFTWHVCPPTTGSSCRFEGDVKGEITEEQFTDVVADGTELNNAWKARLDEVVPYFQQLKDAGIPAFFRPFHEMNEEWNWWGARPGENGTARLYQLTRDYLEGARGLDNLIWVWNVQDNPAGNWASYYPGDSYVDVVSLDSWYKAAPSQSDYDQLRAIAGGKPLAIAELGRMPTEELLAGQPEWTYFMMWSEHLLGENTPEEIRATYNNPRVLNQGEVAIG